MASKHIAVCRIVVVLAAALALSGLAAAQSTATLTGTVRDPQGAVVPNATVTITDAAKGVQHVTHTDGSGLYQMPSLPVGVYNVVVEAGGLQKQEVRGVILNVSQTVVQDFGLRLPTATEAVTVEGQAPIIERSTITVGDVIDQTTVQEIPLNGRHFVDLALLIPGTVTPPANGFLTTPLRGQGSFAFVTAGNREDSTNFMINGVNLNDIAQNQITFQPTINTVQEFKVDNSTYSAEFGRNSGSIVNIATRSGTNAYHGEVFDFLRNDVLDARNYFNPVTVAKSPFKRNDFGADVGGPIIKNKLFFFGSYEGLRQRQGLTVLGDVPTDAQRATVVDTTSQQILALIPHQNCLDARGNPAFCGSSTAPVNIDQWTGDAQYTISPKDSLHGFYAFQRDHRVESLAGVTLPGFGDIREGHRQILTLNETHVFSGNVVNEGRIGFNRIHITFFPVNNTDPTTLGINDGNSGPVGLPSTRITTLGLVVGGPLGDPEGRGDVTGVASDTVSWLHGRHSFKFGGEFRRFSNNNFIQDPGTVTFNNLTDFANGQIDTFQVTPGSQPSRIYGGALGFFVMDTVKATRTLTLELGLRYDWNMSPTEAAGRFITFDPASSALVAVNPAYTQSDKNFEPRLGFAWDLAGNGRYVLRAGYGYMVDQPVANVVSGLSSNPPLAVPVSITTPTTWGTAFASAAGGGIAPNIVDPNFKNPYVQSWNVNWQEQLSDSMSLMIGYFGSRGTHLRMFDNINQLTNGVRPFTQVVSSADFTCPNAQFASCPKLGNILEQASEGASNYKALWITMNRRFSRGVQFSASYTLSESFDYNSLNSGVLTSQIVENSFDPHLSYGPSDFDARHRFVVNLVWDLPFHGSRLKDGWELSTITQIQSGNPINIVSASPKGTNIAGFTGLANIAPDEVGPIVTIGSPGQWFSNSVCDPQNPANCPATANWRLPVTAAPNPAVFHFGNYPRNSLYGPEFDDIDLSTSKTTKLTERMSFQLRADYFNILNHPNFGQPGNVAGSSTFGVITSTRFPVGDSGSSRQIQVAAKFLF